MTQCASKSQRRSSPLARGALHAAGGGAAKIVINDLDLRDNATRKLPGKRADNFGTAIRDAEVAIQRSHWGRF